MEHSINMQRNNSVHFICHQCHRSFKTHRRLTQHHILRNDEKQVQRYDDAVSSQVKTRVKDTVIKVKEERNVECFYWNTKKKKGDNENYQRYLQQNRILEKEFVYVT